MEQAEAAIEGAAVGGKQVIALAKETFKEFSEDEATWKAAALSYFTVFALAPLLVILLQVASLIWDPAQVRQSLTGQFQAVMGADVAHQVETMMMSAERNTASGSGVRLILSIAGLLFGATGAFVSLQQALNRAWEVEPDPKHGGVMNFITKRFLSLGMVLGIAFLLLVSLALTAALSAAGSVLFGGFGGALAQALNFVLTFVVITVLFAAMFKVLPDAKVDWRDVWVGAIATAIFFVVGKFLIGLYIGKSNPGSAFGAAGALAVLLVWIYYAAVILLLGAEFTQAWMKQHGREIEPEEGAVRVVEVKQRVGDSASPPRGGDDTRNARPAAAGKSLGTGGDAGGKKSDAIVAVQREMADTRERMSGTVRAIESRTSEIVDDAKAKANPAGLVRKHPWPAIAAAVVAGVALSTARSGDVDGEGADASSDGGIVHRARAGVARAVESRVSELGQEIREASEAIGRSTPNA